MIDSAAKFWQILNCTCACLWQLKMPSGFEHLKNIKFGLGFSLTAIAVAIVLVTTVQAALGGAQYESPLLLTLIAVTVSTAAIGVVTTGVRSNELIDAEQNVAPTAIATYVFANAAGTLATLIGHLVETWETGRKTKDVGSHDALTIILDLLSLTPATYFSSYLAATGVFVLLAFWLVFWSAPLIAGKRLATALELESVGTSSLCLLIMGLLVGTPWAPIEEDTSAAMSSIGAGVRLGIFAIVAITVFAFARLITRSVIHLSIVLSLSAIRFGAKVGGENFRLLMMEIAKQCVYGLLIFLVAIVFIGIVWLVGLPIILPALFESQESVLRFVEISKKVVVDASTILLWALVVVACLILFRLFGKPALKGIAHIIHWFALGLFNAVKLLLAVFLFVIGTVVEAFLIAARVAAWLFRKNSKRETAAVNNSSKGGWFSDAWSGVAPNLSWPTIDFSSLSKLAIMAALFGGGLFAYDFLNDRSGRGIDPQQVLIETPDPPQSPPPPGFEFSRPQAVSLCEARPGGFDWALAREDRLEVRLSDCSLPALIRDASNGVLVVVSVSSFSSNEARENQRALRRARSLAEWASFSTPDGMPVYVLNLGMARNERAFESGWRRFGDVRGERPALALLLKPFPEDSTLPVSSVLEELASGLRFADVSANFTKCELLKLSQEDSEDAELVAVSEFNCGVL